ncbi:MAG TPA: GNAT family N-acetyltransferase [Bryobacteraceae bacterium]|nr:GNAT family N-acetyltransferase [Bryobacteraceae bacterium]
MKTASPLVDESVSQWAAALRRMIVCSPAFESPDLHGLHAFWGNVPMPFYNHACLSRPIDDLPGMRRRIEPLLRFAAQQGWPWMFSPCDDWLPAGASEYLSNIGLVPAMALSGMAAECSIEPVAAAAQDVRPLSGTSGALLVGELNCLAYGMPLEWAEQTQWASFFGSDVFSYALYESDQPASTATVFITDNCLNVVCVATAPAFQRKGYAEAVMRHGLNEAMRATGLRHSVLHASEAGRPLYERMGYRTVAKFTAWTSPHT